MTQEKVALLVGASRGLGLAMAEELASRGWQVIATRRDASNQDGLQELAARSAGAIEIERVDIRSPAGIAALRDTLAERRLDLLFVNAGIANRDLDQPVGEVDEDVFVDVMMTNALGPMRVIEALDGLVVAGGLIGVMSSGQGSVANNTSGRRELYRGSKAALNSFMRSYAARTAHRRLSLALMAPGWVRTELGGPQAPLRIEDSIPGLVETLLAKRGRPGLEYLDYKGEAVAW